MSIVSAVPLQREIDDTELAWIKKHPLFAAMRNGIATGEILPTLRNHEVHFYEGGARLLRFTGNAVFTHRKYIDGAGEKERRLSEVEQNSTATLEQVRSAAKSHRKADRELVAVHQLFRDFAITRCGHCSGDLALIDVEARFAAGTSLQSNMIDLVFLLPDRQLLFIEAKCVANREVRSTTIAKVVCQVGKYERHIKRTGVLDALNRSLSLQSELMGWDFGQARDFVRRVPLLILDPAGWNSSHKSTETWLKNARETASNWSCSSEEIALIDGIAELPADASARLSKETSREPQSHGSSRYAADRRKLH